MPIQRHIRNDDDGIAIVTLMVHPMHHHPIPMPTLLANPIVMHAIGTEGANIVVVPAIRVPPWNTHHHPPLQGPFPIPAPIPACTPSTPAKVNSHVIQNHVTCNQFSSSCCDSNAGSISTQFFLHGYICGLMLPFCIFAPGIPLINYHKIFTNNFLSFFF
jgi:hypothetical protein